jgi:urea transport system substrate-binding protein
MIILFVLVFLILLAIVFAFLEQWERMRTRMIISGVLMLAALFAVMALFRYQLVHSTGCAPNCAGANLVGRDLSGMQLSDIDLVEANLSRADLSQAELMDSDLSGAIMLAVNLEGANLQNARLAGAEMTGANLAGANLTGADLSGANLSETNLTGVDLSRTIVKGAWFRNAQLIGMNLAASQLNAVDFTGAKMNGVRLVNSNLSGAVLSSADLSGAQMSNSLLTGAWLNRALLIGADMTNTDLSGSSMVATDLASADLTNSNLLGSNLIGANLKGANLSGADLRGVRLDIATLLDTDIRLDPVLAELNELQRSRAFVDAQLDGVSFNSQTTWPDSPIAQRIAGAQARVEEITTVTTDTIKIGLLHSLSGVLASSETPLRDAILLAVDEINAAGGVLGQPIEPILEDGAESPETFTEKAVKLLETDQVVAIFGGSISTNRKAVIPVIEEAGSLLFYPTAYEGFERSPNTFYIGAEPSQQIIPAIDFLLSQGKTKFLLIGSDAPYPRTVNRIIKAQLASVDLEALGEVYIPRDITDFSQFIAQLQAVVPEVIINTLQGDGNLAFFTQLGEAGFTAATLPVMNLIIAEEEVRLIGPQIMTGYWVASTYFQTTQTPENFAFVTAFKTAHGQDRVVSDAAASAYSAVYLWKTLVEAAESTDTAEIQRVAANEIVEYVSPKGLIRIDSETQHVFATARVGTIRPDGLIEEIYASEEPLQPDPYLTQFDWAADLEEELDESP